VTTNRQALIEAFNTLIKDTDELPFEESETIYLAAGLGMEAGLDALLRVIDHDDDQPTTINIHLN